MYTASQFLSDIPLAVANQAHSGTSFVPEKRGESERNSYAEAMAAFYNKVLSIAGEARHDEALADLEAFRVRYRDRQIGLLRRRSGLMSTMIAGPSNFPAARMNKKNASYDNAVQEFLAWDERVSSAILRKYNGSEVIRTGSVDGVKQLEEKLCKLERNQEIMKASNKVIKGKGTDDEKVDALLAIDDNLTEAQARELLAPNRYQGHIGYASYSLTNNSANIRRVKDQLEKAKRLAAQETSEKMIGAVRCVNNCEDDRLELYFPTRTSKEVYAELKSHGFRYTPSKSIAPEGCFQAFRGGNAEYWAGVIAEKYNAECSVTA